MELPDWIPKEAWDGWVEMRSRIKKPLTKRAIGMAISKLWDFKNRGYDIAKILDASTFNCWQGLFEPKEAIHNARESFEQQKRRREEKALGDVFAGAGQVLQRLEGDLANPRSDKKTTRNLPPAPRRPLP